MNITDRYVSITSIAARQPRVLRWTIKTGTLMSRELSSMSRYFGGSRWEK